MNTTWVDGVDGKMPVKSIPTNKKETPILLKKDAKITIEIDGKIYTSSLSAFSKINNLKSDLIEQLINANLAADINTIREESIERILG